MSLFWKENKHLRLLRTTRDETASVVWKTVGGRGWALSVYSPRDKERPIRAEEACRQDSEGKKLLLLLLGSKCANEGQRGGACVCRESPIKARGRNAAFKQARSPC